MTASTSFTFIGFSGEKSGFTVYNPDLDAVNVATYTDVTVGQALGNMKAAVDALTLMNEVSLAVGAARILSPGSLPADQNAQREQKLLVKYVDLSTNKKYSFSIPGIDRSLVAQAGTDIVDFTGNALVIALIAAFEANYVSELGNTVEVYDVRLVGRNN